MFKKVMSKPFSFLKMALFAVLAISAIACGYDDLNKEREAEKELYYSEDKTARTALIEADTLKSYIDAGYRTPDGKKVVILYVGTPSSSKNETVAGAYFFDKAVLFGNRTDGPVFNSTMVGTGDVFDGFLREYGIDENTLVVLTTSDATQHPLYRSFWTFKYWGFSNKAVKVLNGADKYYTHLIETKYAKERAKYIKPFRTDKPVPSTFSVTKLLGNNIDLVRAPIGEIVEYVKAGALKADGTGSAIVVPTVNAKTPVVSNGKTITYVMSNSNPLEGRIKGATQLALTGNAESGYSNAILTFQDEYGRFLINDEEMIKAFKGLTKDTTEAYPFLPTDKNKRLIFHCVSGQSTAPFWFFVKEVLGYYNSAIYDGSWGEWVSLPLQKGLNGSETFSRQFTDADKDGKYDLTKPATDFLKWNGTKFVYNSNGADADRDMIPNGKMNNPEWDMTKYTSFITLSNLAPEGTYDNSYRGDGKEINKQDKDYHAGKTENGNGGSNKPGTGGGAPAGC